MKKIDGRKIAVAILSDIKKEIRKKKIKPGLAVLLAGRDSASEIYVRIKRQKAEETGIKFSLMRFGADAKENKIIDTIKKLNADSSVSGIIVQLPLPKNFNTQKIIDSIDVNKDADGFSAGGTLVPVFPQAIVTLIDSVHVDLRNKKATVIANSKLFGETTCAMLRDKKIKAECILKKDISKRINTLKKSDIIVTAVGEKGIIKKEMIKRGAVVIDGGISKEGKKIFGDVDFESLQKTDGYITPVIGGVGPITVALLLRNVLKAWKLQNESRNSSSFTFTRS